MIDTHIHLSHHLFDGELPYLTVAENQPESKRSDRDQLIRQFDKSGVTAVIEPAIDIRSNNKLLALADLYPRYVFAAVGVHCLCQ